MLLIGLAILTGERFVLQLLPMAVSLFLLGTFGWSLRAGPPLVERFARLVDPDLPDFCVPYCRKVTIVWCVFLAANALCAGLLAWLGSFEAWALYTGFIAYLLLGAAFAGEFILRKLWFRFYGDGPADRILARLFPARAHGQRPALARPRGTPARADGYSFQRLKTSEVLIPPNAKLLLITTSTDERPRLAADVVERRAALVDHVQVERRREPALAHHLDRDPGLDRAAGAERVREVALERADRRALPKTACVARLSAMSPTSVAVPCAFR